ncbi:MAG: hypothetical protein RSB85_01030, partial [Rikenellaceae bacterium]
EHPLIKHYDLRDEHPLIKHYDLRDEHPLIKHYDLRDEHPLIKQKIITFLKESETQKTFNEKHSSSIIK